MRAYFTTSIPQAQTVLTDGFTDLNTVGETRGAWLTDRPLDVHDNEGDADVTLCLELPDAVFSRYEQTEVGTPHNDPRTALIPAAVLNQFGPAQVFDCVYVGSRWELVHAIRKWQALACPDSTRYIRELREAIRFLDGIGWLNTVKEREGRAP